MMPEYKISIEIQPDSKQVGFVDIVIRYVIITIKNFIPIKSDVCFMTYFKNQKLHAVRKSPRSPEKFVGSLLCRVSTYTPSCCLNSQLLSHGSLQILSLLIQGVLKLS